MSIKNWIINPCNKCLVYACCVSGCSKLKSFVKIQTIIWISFGAIITFSILEFFVYQLFNISIIYLVIFVICWLILGYLIYKAISSSDKDDIFKVSLSFIWLPFVIISTFIGGILPIIFMKKRNKVFIFDCNTWN